MVKLFTGTPLSRLQTPQAGVAATRPVAMPQRAAPTPARNSDTRLVPISRLANGGRWRVEAMRACGCDLNNASIQHSFLALACIPELRLSDLGLVDVRTFQLTGLFE